jgi:hypothetical protein
VAWSWFAPAVVVRASATHPADNGIAATTPAIPVASNMCDEASAVASVQASAPVPGDAVGRQRLAGWLREHVAAGSRVEDPTDGPLAVVHAVAPGETALTIAQAHLDLTDVYRAKDLAVAIAKENPDLHAGAEARIPHLLAAPSRSPEEDRMVWPADRALKGIYLTSGTAGASWPEMVERVHAHGMNAIVLDAKEYAGGVTYPTHVRLALASGAGRGAPIRDFPRAIRFAHERGVAVIARITCFHDPWLAAYAPRLSVRSTSGDPLPIGWVDPASSDVQDYLIDLVKEVVDLGADEVQLDYVRFPVQDAGDAALLPADGHRTKAITAFVARVHEFTSARHVPLSLDVFGIAASAPRSDVEALGQNVVLLGPVAEAISPMVYPSHYPVGFLGLERPGDHPELVGFGTKAAVTKLKDAQVGETIVRPWLQAAAFRTTEFGPRYVQDEIRSAEASGATGWLMWDAGNSYWAVWRALPVVDSGGAGRPEVTASR